MKSKSKIKHINLKILYTSLTALLMICVFVATIGYIYIIAEKNAYESLHVRTNEIKEELNLQITSDRGNLETVARIAESLNSTEGGFELLVKSFESIGFIDNIGILLPDGRLITKVGTFDSNDSLIYSEEIIKGAYTSGRIQDVTNDERYVVRMAEPLTVNGRNIGILYGTIPLLKLADSMMQTTAEGSGVMLVERSSGNLILDTENGNVSNISALAQRKYCKDYTYAKLIGDVEGGISGYTSFFAANTKNQLYIHHSPLEISDWTVLLSEPKARVFEEANTMSIFASIIFTVGVAIMSLYVFIIIKAERRSAILNLYAAKIRKILLGINQQETAASDALKSIAAFGNARSAFFVDTNGDDYSYIKHQDKSIILMGDERSCFVNELFDYAEKYRTELNIEVSSFKITANSALKEINEKLYSFFTEHGINTVSFAAVVQNVSNQKSLIGVINSEKRSHADVLIEEIAVCFSMAIYNKNYLLKTESVANTDALTGLCNRMAYKRDSAHFDELTPENFACIYIDVNELHIINNTYGHAAGDGLLLFISNLLKERFADSHIYRIGGDEFLIFTENTDEIALVEKIKQLEEDAAKKKRYISVGMAFCKKNLDTETLVNEAEKRMYHAKAMYYRDKDAADAYADSAVRHTVYINTGNQDVDLLLPIIESHYRGVYRVNLTNDTSKPIITPYYLRAPEESGKKFTAIYARYVHEYVHPDCQRPMNNFIKYDVLKKQLLENITPTMVYKKTNGEKFRVSVYKATASDELLDTVWVFEKEA